ncbi:DNA-binding transcriptional regulator [Lachnospiraceae bacterium KM106-2]|nr:DNA-binding transcriptional regulator [Lachnospiraceae bacterium KM106-2]
MAKQVKMADIADRLGVSIVTVSKALSGKKGVSEDVREQIKKTANEMGYTLNASKKKEKQDKSWNIGVVVAERYLGGFASFYWEMYQNLVVQGNRKNCFLILEVINSEDEQAGTAPKIVKENRVDGLIVIGKLAEAQMNYFKYHMDIPFVSLDYYTNGIEFDSVISDGFYGMYVVTNYLFDMGHRDIAFVGSILATNSITDRYLGYQKSMMEHGLSIRDEWIISDREDEAKVALSLPEHLPTAFVCNCDYTAGVLYNSLLERGIRVPEDVSITGFDNYMYSHITKQEFTTYDVNMKEMAKASFHVILKKINNESYVGGLKIVEGHMVLRDSVKKIN